MTEMLRETEREGGKEIEREGERDRQREIYMEREIEETSRDEPGLEVV